MPFLLKTDTRPLIIDQSSVIDSVFCFIPTCIVLTASVMVFMPLLAASSLPLFLFSCQCGLVNFSLLVYYAM